LINLGSSSTNHSRNAKDSNGKFQILCERKLRDYQNRKVSPILICIFISKKLPIMK
jgi:hypothetical protein